MNSILLDEITLQGFNLIQAEYFSHQVGPIMTIRSSSLAFNTSAYKALENCEAVHIMINSVEKKIVVKPINSDDKDAVKWIKDLNNPKSVPIECTALTRRLYEAWRWDEQLRYQAYGKQVMIGSKVALLFDFNRSKIYRGFKLVESGA